jgi:hypothetical protein
MLPLLLSSQPLSSLVFGYMLHTIDEIESVEAKIFIVAAKPPIAQS